jgi:hypothetical protein
MCYKSAMTIQTDFGKGSVRADGYVHVMVDGKYRMEHHLVVERALGKALSKPAEVHHVNENHSDNRPTNLVVCPDRAYHKLLHQRMRAFEATGSYDKRPCKYCKEYDVTSNLVEQHNNGSFHKACRDKYNAAYRQRILEAHRTPVTVAD